jgi:hypothetical protein
MQDRYVIRPISSVGRWRVWDTHSDAVVFGGEDMTDDEARAMARRLNEAYRRSVRDE